MEADCQVGGLGESCFRVLYSAVFSWINLNCTPEMQFWKVLTSSANKALSLSGSLKMWWNLRSIGRRWRETKGNIHSLKNILHSLLLFNLCP